MAVVQPNASLVTGKTWNDMSDLERTAHVIARGNFGTDRTTWTADDAMVAEANAYLDDLYGDNRGMAEQLIRDAAVTRIAEQRGMDDPLYQRALDARSIYGNAGMYEGGYEQLHPQYDRVFGWNQDIGVFNRPDLAGTDYEGLYLPFRPDTAATLAYLEQNAPPPPTLPENFMDMSVEDRQAWFADNPGFSFLPGGGVNRSLEAEDMAAEDLKKWHQYYTDRPELRAFLSLDEQQELLYLDHRLQGTSEKDYKEASYALRRDTFDLPRKVGFEGSDSAWEWQYDVRGKRETGDNPYEDLLRNQGRIGAFANRDKPDDGPLGGGFLGDLLSNPIAGIALGIAAPWAAPAIGTALGLSGTAGLLTGSALFSGGLTALQGGDLDDIFKAAAGGAVTAGLPNIMKSVGLDKVANVMQAQDAVASGLQGFTNSAVTQAIMNGEISLEDAARAGLLSAGLTTVKDVLRDSVDTRDVQKMTEEGTLNEEYYTPEEAYRLRNTSDMAGLLGPEGWLSKLGIETGYLPTDWLGKGADFLLGHEGREFVITPDGRELAVIQDSEGNRFGYDPETGERFDAQQAYQRNPATGELIEVSREGLNPWAGDPSRYDERFVDWSAPRGESPASGIWEKNLYAQPGGPHVPVGGTGGGPEGTLPGRDPVATLPPPADRDTTETPIVDDVLAGDPKNEDILQGKPEEPEEPAPEPEEEVVDPNEEDLPEETVPGDGTGGDEEVPAGEGEGELPPGEGELPPADREGDTEDVIPDSDKEDKLPGGREGGDRERIEAAGDGAGWDMWDLYPIYQIPPLAWDSSMIQRLLAEVNQRPRA